MIENLSYISNNCVVAFLYQLFNPEVNSFFIEYKSPFVSPWIPCDENYVKLCERYEYYDNIEPFFGDPKNEKWEIESGSKRGFGWGDDYPIMYIDDVEIHWLHERLSQDGILQKFKERRRLYSDLHKVFLWGDMFMYNIHTSEERSNLINRFLQIPYDTIFFTKYSSESMVQNNSCVKFIKEWEEFETLPGKISQWSTLQQVAIMYKNVLEKMYD